MLTFLMVTFALIIISSKNVGEASSPSFGGCGYGVRTMPAVSDYGYVEYHPSGRICWYY